MIYICRYRKIKRFVSNKIMLFECLFLNAWFSQHQPTFFRVVYSYWLTDASNGHWKRSIVRIIVLYAAAYRKNAAETKYLKKLFETENLQWNVNFWFKQKKIRQRSTLLQLGLELCSWLDYHQTQAYKLPCKMKASNTEISFKHMCLTTTESCLWRYCQRISGFTRNGGIEVTFTLSLTTTVYWTFQGFMITWHQIEKRSSMKRRFIVDFNLTLSTYQEGK